MVPSGDKNFNSRLVAPTLRKCGAYSRAGTILPHYHHQRLRRLDGNPCGTKLLPSANSLRHYDAKTKTDTIWAGRAEKRRQQLAWGAEFQFV
jgi:hypothetical protein